MSQEKIKCPQCGAQFELTEVIFREIEATIGQKYETQINILKGQADAREKQLREQFKSEQQKIAEQAKKTGDKMELVYNYLTGPEFKNRIEAIVSSFVAMKSVLDAEKRAMQKLWARREKQIERVIGNISGMHGDLEGIAGKALPVIKVLELPVDGGEEESAEAQEWLKDDSLES